MPEEQHEKARKYVKELAGFLEKTKNYSNIVTVYDSPYIQTRKIDYNGKEIKFDLKGQYFKDKLDVYIEAKNYKKSDDLGSHYKKFLKQCFSIWVREQEQISSDPWIAWFFFIASHPFYCTKTFKELKSLDFLRRVLEEIDSNDKSKEKLQEYLSSNTEDIIEKFLKNIEILYVTPNYRLLMVNIPAYFEEIRLFTNFRVGDNNE